MITVGKHGRYAHISILANALAGTPEEFSNSSGTWRGVAEKVDSTGQLPIEWREVYTNTNVVYTVFSYNTPIAWKDSDGQWTVPEVSYWRTTTNHQSALRYALTVNKVDYVFSKRFVSTPELPESLFNRTSAF